MASIRHRPEKTRPYQVRYANPNTGSGYAYKSFLRARDAKAFKAERDLAEDRGEIAPATPRLTVPDAIKSWLLICETEGTDGNDPVSAYTLANYRYYASFMKGYDWPCDLGLLTTPDVVAFRTWLLGNTPSRYVARKTLAYFKTVISEQVLRGTVSNNVAAGLVVKDQSRYDDPLVVPTEADIKALLSAADRLAQSANGTIAKAWKRYRPLLYLAVDSGLRPQEYLALCKRHLVEGAVVVEQAIQGDGKRISVPKTISGRRIVPLSPTVFALLQDHAQDFEPDDLLFPSKTGGLMDRRNWQRRGFNVACLEAGLMIDGLEQPKPKYIPYDLRHFFASTIIEYVPNLKRIQKMIGHKNIEQTLNTYAHLIEDRQDEDRDYSKPFNGVVESLRSI